MDIDKLDGELLFESAGDAGGAPAGKSSKLIPKLSAGRILFVFESLCGIPYPNPDPPTL